MNGKTSQLDTLSSSTTYSLILFALYKLHDVPEYSCLSELAFVLDKTNLFKLCEFFGGLTIKIPTSEELIDMTKALYLYQRIEIEGADVKVALSEIDMNITIFKTSKLLKYYNSIKDTMHNYNFGSADNDRL